MAPSAPVDVRAAVERAGPVLDLEDTDEPLGPAGARALADALEGNDRFEHISIAFGNVGDAGASAVADSLHGHRALRKLNMSNNGLGDDGAASVAELLKANTEVEEIKLGSNRIGIGGLQSIADALVARGGIHALDLSGNGVGPDGTRALVGVAKENRHLCQLNLVDNKIGDEGAALIADAIKQGAAIKHLRLHFNGIGPAGARSLANALIDNTVLESLHLAGNTIGDAGVKALAAALIQNTTMTELDIAGNGIGPDGGATFLEMLRKNVDLTKVDVRGNRFSLPDISGLDIVQSPLESRSPNLKGEHHSAEDGQGGEKQGGEDHDHDTSSSDAEAPHDAEPNGAVSERERHGHLPPGLGSAPAAAVSPSYPPGLGPARKYPPGLPIPKDDAVTGNAIAHSHAAGGQAGASQGGEERVRSNAAEIGSMLLVAGNDFTADSAAGLDFPWWHFLLDTEEKGLQAADQIRDAIDAVEKNFKEVQQLKDEVSNNMKEYTTLQARIRKSKKSVPEALVKKRGENLDLVLAALNNGLRLEENIRDDVETYMELLEGWREDLENYEDDMGAFLRDAPGNEVVTPEDALRAVLAWRTGPAATNDETISRLSSMTLPEEYESTPLAAVMSATARLLRSVDMAIEHGKTLQRMAEEFRKQQRQLSTEPPTPDLLHSLQADLGALKEGLLGGRIKLRSARRRKDPGLAELERSVADLERKNKEGLIVNRIADERARLYRVAERLYPELLVEGSDFSKAIKVQLESVDYEAQRLGLVHEGLSLASFTELQVLAPARKSLKVADAAGLTWVIKRFQPAGADQLRHFYRQASNLRRLRDPHVLSVAAVFKDGDDYCWQLPYFRGGNLEQWLRTNRVGTRDRAVAQRIMNDVLKGLKHLHEKDFVHGDIKPSNILLSQDGRAVLSDFDGIRDVDASASQTYWAPELKSGKAKRFTQATDVFAVGFIAQEVFEGMKWNWKNGVDKMMSQREDLRPKAGDCVQWATFSAPEANVVTCGSCFEIFDADAGLSCAEGHFLCTPCLERRLAHLTSLDGPLAFSGLYFGNMSCWEPDCDAPELNAETIAEVVSPPVFSAYVDGLSELQRAQDEKERSESLRHAAYISKRILLPRCPRCGKTAEFSGSLAMCCSDERKCRGSFCAFCREDCGVTPVEHLVACRFNSGYRDAFAPPEIFEAANAQWVKRMVVDYWKREVAGLEEEEKEATREAVKQDLAKYGIDVDTLP